MHGGYGRFRAIPEAHDDPEVLVQRLADRLRAGRRASGALPHVEIEARRECPPGAGHHDRAHIVVRFGEVQGAVELLDHRGIDGIELVGPVQRQQRQRTDPLVANELECHGLPCSLARHGGYHPGASRSQADFICV